MKKSTIIIIVVIALLAIWGVTGYNGLVTMDENVSGQWSNVETQYQRRADLIPNLVNTVKGYATHEKETLEGVVEARSKATQIKVDAADLTPEKLAEYQKAQGAVTSALGKLLAITEFPGTAGTAGRYGKPYQRSTYQLQQCSQELQYSHSPFPQEYPCRSLRF